MFASARLWKTAGLAWLAALAGCLLGPNHGFDGGPCIWNFPADDPCASSGLVCRLGPTGDQGGTICQLPGELFRCSPQHGCNASYLSCTDVPVAGIGSVPLCVRSCATAGSGKDCPNPYSFCQPLPDAGTNACLLAGCIGAYQLASCQVGDSAPGTCLPFRAGTTSVALCQGSGPAAAGESCSTGDSYGPLCAQGTVCLSQQCFTACSRNAGPACPSGTLCSPPYVVNESAAFFDGVYSFCLAPCSQDAGAGCIPPLSCYEPSGMPGFCLP
jgi:hypothetical protein